MLNTPGNRIRHRLSRSMAPRPRAAPAAISPKAGAPLARIRDRYRYRLLLKAPREVRVQAPVRAWLERVDIPRSLRVQVDIDPYSFL